jgi:hypothetical protein
VTLLPIAIAKYRNKKQDTVPFSRYWLILKEGPLT